MVRTTWLRDCSAALMLQSDMRHWLTDSDYLLQQGTTATSQAQACAAINKLYIMRNDSPQGRISKSQDRHRPCTKVSVMTWSCHQSVLPFSKGVLKCASMATMANIGWQNPGEA